MTREYKSQGSRSRVENLGALKASLVRLGDTLLGLLT